MRFNKDIIVNKSKYHIVDNIRLQAYIQRINKDKYDIKAMQDYGVEWLASQFPYNLDYFHNDNKKANNPKLILRREDSIENINNDYYSICHSKIPNKYYKIIEYIDNINYNVFIFIGKQADIFSQIFKKIEQRRNR